MKRLPVALYVALSIVAVAYGGSLASSDRERGIKHLQATRQSLLDATKGLSAAQWNFKPAADQWSVAEVAEHLAATEDMLYDLISQQVMKAPPRPNGEDVKALDELVLTRVPDRTKKFQAAEVLRPTNRYGSPDATVKHFVESRDKTIQYLQKTGDLRAHALDSPLGKKLDGYQWILYISAHTERHMKQINEVKADPNFPKM